MCILQCVLHIAVQTLGGQWHGGRRLDVLSALLGFPCDGSKSVSESLEMALLSGEVAVMWARCLVTMVVARAKAQAWQAALVGAKRDAQIGFQKAWAVWRFTAIFREVLARRRGASVC